MSKKRKSLISEEFEKELEEIIRKNVSQLNKEITEKDIKSIIKSLTPDLDRIISNRVKEHFVDIAEYVLKKFN